MGSHSVLINSLIYRPSLMAFIVSDGTFIVVALGLEFYLHSDVLKH